MSFLYLFSYMVFHHGSLFLCNISSMTSSILRALICYLSSDTEKKNKIALSCSPLYIYTSSGQLIQTVTMSTGCPFENENHSSSILDPDNRDPMHINKHLQVEILEKTTSLIPIIFIFFSLIFSMSLLNLIPVPTISKYFIELHIKFIITVKSLFIVF